MRLSYLYHENSCTGKSASLYWNGPLIDIGADAMAPCITRSSAVHCQVISSYVIDQIGQMDPCLPLGKNNNLHNFSVEESLKM